MRGYLDYSSGLFDWRARIGLAIACFALLAWSTAGMTSGYVVYFVTRRDPLHLSGLPALVFCGALIVCAVGTAAMAVRGSTQAFHQITRRFFKWAAASLVGLAFLTAVAESIGLLPSTGGSSGLASTEQLVAWMKSAWLSPHIGPHAKTSALWSGVLFAAGTAGMLILYLLGFIKSGQRMQPWVQLFVLIALVGPAIGAFSAFLIHAIAIADLASKASLAEDGLRWEFAWFCSRLIFALMVMAVALTWITETILTHSRSRPINADRTSD